MESAASKIAVIGAGAWGNALAISLANNGQTVQMWSSNRDQMNTLISDRINQQFVPNVPFPENLKPCLELSEALNGVQDILIVVPSHAFRICLESLLPHKQANWRIAWATKGLDSKTGKLLHNVVDELFGDAHPQAMLAGPSFAQEVALGLPTAVNLASNNKEFAEDLRKRFLCPVFRVYLSEDIPGLEVGGAVKNIIAIAAGISDGLGFGANARCAVIARGLAEMIRLGEVLGAKQKTLIGLAGMGDLVLTCTDNQSRNRRFGVALGEGQSVEQALETVGHVVEGYNNANEVYQLAKKHSVEMPITEQIYLLINGQTTSHAAFEALLSRDIGPE